MVTCEVLDNYSDFLKNYEKLYAKEFYSKYDDYRDIYQKEKTDYIDNKRNMFANQKQLSKSDLKNT